MRRGGHECLNKAASSRYYQIQEREALIFTENLLQDTKDWHQEVSRKVYSALYSPLTLLINGILSSSISLLLSTVYDVPPTLSLDDPLIKKFNNFDNLIIDAAYPGNHLVEFFGLMKFLPSNFAPWKRRAEKGFIEFSTFFEQLCRDIKKQLVRAVYPVHTDHFYWRTRMQEMKSLGLRGTSFGSKDALV